MSESELVTHTSLIVTGELTKHLDEIHPKYPCFSSKNLGCISLNLGRRKMASLASDPAGLYLRISLKHLLVNLHCFKMIQNADMQQESIANGQTSHRCL